MNQLKVITIKRKITPRNSKGGGVTILRAEVTLAASGSSSIRVPLPKRYAEKLNWKIGDDVFVTLTEDGKVIVEQPKTMEKAS